MVSLRCLPEETDADELITAGMSSLTNDEAGSQQAFSRYQVLQER